MNLYSFLKRRGWGVVSVEIKKSKVPVHAEAIGSLFVHMTDITQDSRNDDNH
jgi:hypothetical protein